jgi:hypothetical protein
MVLVALAAANMGLLRFAGPRWDYPLFCGLPVLLLQGAAYRALRGRGAGRAFGAGYLVLGGVATASLGWVLTCADYIGPAGNGMFSAEIIRDQPLVAFWLGLSPWLFEVVERAWQFGLGPMPGIARPVVVATSFVIPQVAAGWLGGGIGWWLGRLSRRRRDGFDARSGADRPPGEASP